MQLSKKTTVTQSNNKKTVVRVDGAAYRDGRCRSDFYICDKTTGKHAHYSADGKTGKVTKHHDLKR